MPRLQSELNGILGWIEQLNEVDVEGVEPLTGAAAMALRMRDDVVTDGGIRDAVLSNAPDRAGLSLLIASPGDPADLEERLRTLPGGSRMGEVGSHAARFDVASGEVRRVR